MVRVWAYTCFVICFRVKTTDRYSLCLAGTLLFVFNKTELIVSSGYDDSSV
jgi:hypothetical protein